MFRHQPTQQQVCDQKKSANIPLDRKQMPEMRVRRKSVAFVLLTY
jgi:hypothetical protein